MADRQPAPRRNSEIDDISDWMARRIADVQRTAQNVGGLEREALGQARRAGQSLLTMRPSDAATLGARYVRQPKPLAKAQGRVALPVKQLAPRTRQKPDWVNPAEKMIAGDAARGVGNIIGAANGAGKTAKDMVGGAGFALRLLDPLDSVIYPSGEAAWDQLFGAGGRALDYAKKAVADPKGAVRDVRHQVHKFQIDNDPSATPMADTVAGEWNRNLSIGKSQGEVAVDVGTTLLGGKALRSLGEVGALSKGARAIELVDAKLSPAAIDYLKQPYTGQGHHFVPRRFRVPERLGILPLPDAIAGRPLPAFISDSPFNVLKPPMSRGEAYALHYQVDPHFHGARLPANVGGGGWSGKRLGLKKHGRLGRIWYGSPTQLKTAVGGTTGMGGLVGRSLYDVANEEEQP